MDRLLNVSLKNFSVFLLNTMKMDEVVVQSEYYNITKFYQILMKNKKVLYITHLTDGPSVKGR